MRGEERAVASQKSSAWLKMEKKGPFVFFDLNLRHLMKYKTLEHHAWAKNRKFEMYLSDSFSFLWDQGVTKESREVF